MKLSKLIATTLFSSLLISGMAAAQVSYDQVRNATGKLSYNDTTFLIDPMLAEKGRYPGFEGSVHSEVRNPTVELPTTKEDVAKDVDAIVLTHTHLDHWDDVAQEFLNKDLPIFVQDEADANTVRQQGFKNITVLNKPAEFQGVTLTRIEGQHGSQAMYDDNVLGPLLGESMGVVFQEVGEKTTYLMGDTVWTPRVSKTLRAYKPDILIMNTGYAKSLNYNDSYIMGTEDVKKAAAIAPDATIITVHMDAINHCTVTRTDMRTFANRQGLDKQVHVPNDGEHIKL